MLVFVQLLRLDSFTIENRNGMVRFVTVLVIIKLTKNAVPLRFRCGSCKLKYCRYFTIFCDIKKRCT